MEKYKMAVSGSGLRYLEKDGIPTICTKLNLVSVGNAIHTSPCMPACPFFIENDDGIILDCRTRQRVIKFDGIDIQQDPEAKIRYKQFMGESIGNIRVG